jgi:hypothetical protein
MAHVWFAMKAGATQAAITDVCSRLGGERSVGCAFGWDWRVVEPPRAGVGRSLERWSADAGRATAAAGAVVGRRLYVPGCPSSGPIAVRTALFGGGLAGDHVATSCFCELTGLGEVRERRAHGRTSEPGGVGDLAGGHRSAVGKSR